MKTVYILESLNALNIYYNQNYYKLKKKKQS